MIRSTPTSATPHAITTVLVPETAPLTLALVSDARLPASVFEGLDADFNVLSRGRGISPLLAPGFDAVLFDLADARADDFQALGRMINLGPRVPVIALFENHRFTVGLANEAIELGAEDACVFDPFNTVSLITQTKLAITRYGRRGTATGSEATPPAEVPTVDLPDAVTVVQEAADAMVILDNDGKVAFANSAAADLLGRPLESLAGQRLNMPMEPGDRDVRIKHPSGEERFADLRIVETEWGGQPARVAALTDTTVRRQLERSMRDAEKKGLTSQRRSQSFFSNVHHDLRTPLTHIIGFSEMMKDAQLGPLSDKYREYAGDIHQSGTMLLDMVEDLLSVAEAEADAITLTDDICNLDALIETVLASQKSNAFEADVELIAIPNAQLPGFRGDAKRLRQGLFRMVSELLHTMDKHTKLVLDTETCAGGLIIKAVVDAHDDGALQLPYDDVEDKSDCARVEDPFVSVAKLSLPRGTGLALSLTRKVVELHGGALRIGQDPRGRPAVIISLPAARIVR
jgi:signal transduction histidine kinase